LGRRDEAARVKAESEVVRVNPTLTKPQDRQTR
jgi:hypothetical protein